MPAATLEQQFVFYPLQGSCKDTDNRHVKVLNVNSVRSPAQLICTICNDADAVRKICERHQVSAPHACSEKERLLAQHLAEHGTAGARRAIVHEIKPFVKSAVFKGSVDILIFADEHPSADPAAIRAGLLVYWDGAQHMRWDNNHRDSKQVADDRRICEHAAQHGYNVLRISHADAATKLTVIDAAFRQCSVAGSLWVSPRWNSGAHHIL